MVEEGGPVRRDRNTLLNVVRPIIADTKKSGGPISPYTVATKAINTLDTRKETEKKFPLLYLAAHLEFRQVTMVELRGKGIHPRPVYREDMEEDAETAAIHQPSFPGFNLLQRHYPKPDGSGYLPLEDMTYDEVEWNADQIENRGIGAIKHAQQLRGWNKVRKVADEK